jgi:hypothetical protein
MPNRTEWDVNNDRIFLSGLLEVWKAFIDRFCPETLPDWKMIFIKIIFNQKE